MHRLFEEKSAYSTLFRVTIRGEVRSLRCLAEPALVTTAFPFE